MSRHLISIAFICALPLISTSVAGAPDLSTRSNADVKGRPYNQEIDKQGTSYYCSSGACDAPPKLIFGRAPVYPPAALANRESGQAIIIFDIKEDGSTGNFQVESATSSEFAAAATKALEQWRFKPAELKGLPTKLRVRQIFPFKLDA